jgi:phage host-nuclease inhibitor protein Gam
MAKTNRLKTPAKVPAFVPQNKDDCAEMINQIGRIHREILAKQSAMNDEIAAITDAYTGVITQWQSELSALQNGVQTWCESNRMDLTEQFKYKTAQFVTGSVQWRQRPQSIVVKGAESVVEWMLAHGMDRFVRVKKEVNKEALLNEIGEAATVPGISIKSGVEDFVITPFEQELS